MPVKSKAKKPQRKATPAALSERLQKFRLENNLSYEDLAELISGVSSETVRRIATSAPFRPHLLTLSKVEKFLSDREANRAA